MWPKRKRPISPQLGEGSSGLAIPDGDHDPPDDDCEPDPLNDESDMLMASALSNLNLGQSPQKRHRHWHIDESQQQDGHQQEHPEHLEDRPDLQGPHEETHMHQEPDQALGWGHQRWNGADMHDPQGPDAAEDVHQQAIPEHGWVDYQRHGAAGNENEFWQWNYTTETWDFWQFHNNWWYKATWRWYLWWEPQQN